jgi:Na+/H+ antiporter nhaA
LIRRIQTFFQSEAAGGILLLLFASMAILLANTSFNQRYFGFLDTPVSVQFGAFSIAKPLLMWVNDGFMAVFFVLVGMEVKREMLEGSLSSYQQAIFPAIAAIGGMAVPALIYFMVAQGTLEIYSGWAIPIATDIAFAIGIVALLGKRVPLPLKVFLLALAIIDDLGAIIVIAIFYSHELSTPALIIAVVTISILVAMNRFKVSALCAYMVVGLILWASVLKSGVHATLAGVIIGFCIPMRGRNGSSPLHQFEHILAPWCSYLILPLFAFSNAGVPLENVGLSSLNSPLTLGIALGLIVGKPLGVFLFSYLSVKLRLAQLPQGVNFAQIFAIAILCGIGFTMSMFLAGLAFGETAYNSFDTLSRLGILLGSGVSAVVGYLLLRKTTSQP